jgi:hypothetical protein
MFKLIICSAMSVAMSVATDHMYYECCYCCMILVMSVLPLYINARMSSNGHHAHYPDPSLWFSDCI